MKKTIISILILTILMLAISFVGCKPSGLSDYSLGSLVGTWVKESSDSYTFNEDGTYTFEVDGSEGWEERANGTYSLDGVKMTLNREQKWDYSDGALVDDENETKIIYTMGNDGDKIAFNNVYYGGNSETMVGSWVNLYTMETIDYDTEYQETIQLNEDGSYNISETDSMSEYSDDIDSGFFKGNRAEPTWELSGDGTQVILTGSEGTTREYNILVLGEGVMITTGVIDEADYYVKQ